MKTKNGNKQKNPLKRGLVTLDTSFKGFILYTLKAPRFNDLEASLLKLMIVGNRDFALEKLITFYYISESKGFEEYIITKPLNYNDFQFFRMVNKQVFLTEDEFKALCNQAKSLLPLFKESNGEIIEKKRRELKNDFESLSKVFSNRVKHFLIGKNLRVVK